MSHEFEVVCCWSSLSLCNLSHPSQGTLAKLVQANDFAHRRKDSILTLSISGCGPATVFCFLVSFPAKHLPHVDVSSPSPGRCFSLAWLGGQKDKDLEKEGEIPFSQLTMSVQAQWPFPQADSASLWLCCMGGERPAELQKEKGGPMAVINAVLCAG